MMAAGAKVAPDVIITVPLPERRRAFLRSVRAAGGRLQIATFDQRKSAEICRDAGYLQILESGKIGRLTGRGQAYLDLLVRST